jgi:hypothetical protein
MNKIIKNFNFIKILTNLTNISNYILYLKHKVIISEVTLYIQSYHFHYISNLLRWHKISL